MLSISIHIFIIVPCIVLTNTVIQSLTARVINKRICIALYCKMLRERKHIEEEDAALYPTTQRGSRRVRQLTLQKLLVGHLLKSVHDDLGHQAEEKTTLLTRVR